jgi:hypothetical protein
MMVSQLSEPARPSQINSDPDSPNGKKFVLKFSRFIQACYLSNQNETDDLTVYLPMKSKKIHFPPCKSSNYCIEDSQDIFKNAQWGHAARKKCAVKNINPYGERRTP